MIPSQLVSRAIMVAPKSCASNTTTTASLDLAGSDYATIEIAFAAELNTNATGPTITLEEGDAVSSVATFNADFNKTAYDCTAANLLVYHVNCKARKRYLKLSITTPNSSNDVILAGVTSNLYKELAPIGTTGQGSVVVIG
jgi:hypothetical protein